jgi:hypothetical protein
MKKFSEVLSERVMMGAVKNPKLQLNVGDIVVVQVQDSTKVDLDGKHWLKLQKSDPKLFTDKSKVDFVAKINKMKDLGAGWGMEYEVETWNGMKGTVENPTFSKPRSGEDTTNMWKTGKLK